MMPKNKVISCFYTDAGGGHRATAVALQALSQNYPPLEIEIVNPYREILPTVIWGKKWFGIDNESIYNRFVLQNGMARLAPILASLAHLNINSVQKPAIRLLTEYLNRLQPQLVLSCHPLGNETFYKSVANYSKEIPFFVLMTDFSESFKNFWIQNKNHNYICGTSIAKNKLLQYGVSPEKIFQTSGMVVHPRFYERQVDNREQALLSLGLQADLPTGLMMFGGYAPTKKSKMILDAFSKQSSTAQLIILCGNNQPLKNTLAAMPTSFPKVVLGYTDKVAYYMQISDFFIGKPGPGSVSEALVSGLPVIVEDNSSVLIQEKPVTAWIRENKFGWTVKQFSQLDKLLPTILADLAEYRQRVSTIQNRAAFEVMEILNRFI